MAVSAEMVNVIDFNNNSVSVDAPAHRIVSLASGATEIVCALDGGQSLVGRGSVSTFPPHVMNITEVGRNSNSPDLELIIELSPDLVIADTMLSADDQKSLEDAGIPVMIERFMSPDRIMTVIKNMGMVMGKKERASEINSFIEKNQKLLQERTADLKPVDMPAVFYESSPTKPYNTFSSFSSFDDIIVSAGGINIAGDLGNESISSPEVTPEWILQVDPDVILQREPSDDDYTQDDLKALRETIISREELKDVQAVKDGRVYVISGKVATGVRSIVGELYLAKWFLPNLFSDIEPEAVHEALIKEFYNLDLEGEYAYPSN
jgi:iron complex transport system substrate-binding protein